MATILFFKNLIKLDVGTKLHSKANFDNTSNNIHNPNTPPVDVYAGEATTDEMFVNYLMYTITSQEMKILI